MFGSVGAWFYQTLAGIRQLDGSIGYAQLNITPPSASALSASPLTGVSASLGTIRGNVSVAWQQQGGMQCAKAHAGGSMKISCGARGGMIAHVHFASYGAHEGDCVAPAYSSYHSPQSKKYECPN